MFLCSSSNAGLTRGESCQAGYTRPSERDFNDLRSERVYINADDPAECNGEVYGWRICPQYSYRSDSYNESETFTVVLSMYSDYAHERFFIVDGSYMELNLTEDQLQDECFDYVLEPSQYFRVKEGNLVAVCWHDEGNRIELAIRQSDKNLITGRVDSCSQTSVHSIETLDDRENRVLLLSAHTTSTFIHI